MRLNSQPVVLSKAGGKLSAGRLISEMNGPFMGGAGAEPLFRRQRKLPLNGDPEGGERRRGPEASAAAREVPPLENGSTSVSLCVGPASQPPLPA